MTGRFILLTLICVVGLAAFVYLLVKRRVSSSLMPLFVVFMMGAYAGWLGGQVAGLLVVALPSLLIFGLGLVFVSPYLLPLQDKHQWLLALQSLVTYTIGTNYPYYAVAEGELVERVGGSPYIRVPLLPLVGPGIVITDCDHVLAVYDGLSYKGVRGPGLVFTDRFEIVQEVVDLRPQLRAFPVDALTKDGISIRVWTFVPFRIDSRDRQPALGHSFPYRPEAVFRAVHRQEIEHKREVRNGQVTKDLERLAWDELVPAAAERIMRDIISRYTLDELCAPYRPDREPRQEIASELKRQLTAEMARWGIQVLGGGISNLNPTAETVLQQRIANWRADWARRIMISVAEGEAERLRQVELARAQAQMEMIMAISEGFEKLDLSEGVIPANVIVFRFVEALEMIASRPTVQALLPGDVLETLGLMRQTAAREQH